jgi:hypothetical protein
MLARDALYLVEGQLNGLREAYRRARVELAQHFQPQPIEEQLVMYGPAAGAAWPEGAAGLRRLSGVRWIPRG